MKRDELNRMDEFSELMELPEEAMPATAPPADGQGLDRRQFLGLTGVGLFLFFNTQPAEALQQGGRGQGGRGGGYPSDFNAYMKIGADGRVTCLVGKVELGQGAMTSLAQILAD